MRFHQRGVHYRSKPVPSWKLGRDVSIFGYFCISICWADQRGWSTPWKYLEDSWWMEKIPEELDKDIRFIFP